MPAPVNFGRGHRFAAYPWCSTDMWKDEEMIGRVAAATLVFLLAAGAVSADVGLPMLAYYLPPAWLLLIPVIGIEALVGVWRHRIAPARALGVQTIANALSTLVGVPIVWSLVTGVELGLWARSWRPTDAGCVLQATLQAWWILPPLRRCAWVFPAALVVATLGFFASSVLLEYAVVRRAMRGVAPRILWAWVLESNAASYAFLIGAAWLFQMAAFEWVWQMGFTVVEMFGSIAFGVARMLGLA